MSGWPEGGATPPGDDLTEIEIDADGVIYNTRKSGEVTTGFSQTIADRTRGRSIAAQRFFKRKRRSWPIPRI